jgi:hypothetical protein
MTAINHFSSGLITSGTTATGATNTTKNKERAACSSLAACHQRVLRQDVPSSKNLKGLHFCANRLLSFMKYNTRASLFAVCLKILRRRFKKEGQYWNIIVV